MAAVHTAVWFYGSCVGLSGFSKFICGGLRCEWIAGVGHVSVCSCARSVCIIVCVSVIYLFIYVSTHLYLCMCVRLSTSVLMHISNLSIYLYLCLPFYMSPNKSGILSRLSTSVLLHMSNLSIYLSISLSTLLYFHSMSLNQSVILICASTIFPLIYLPYV